MKKKLLLFIALLMGFIFFHMPNKSLHAVESVPIVIIANNDVEINTISHDDIKDIYLGKRKRWDNNKRIRFAFLKKCATQSNFLRKFIGINLVRFVHHWRLQVYSGKGKFPIIFDSEKEVVEYIANTKGAIGFVSIDTPRASVKEIEII